MATICIPSPLNPAYTRSSISSPLTGMSSRSSLVPTPSKSPSFPHSRPLRPFTSISPKLLSGSPGSKKKPVKLIEPPKNFGGGVFILDLTQAELSRTD